MFSVRVDSVSCLPSRRFSLRWNSSLANPLKQDLRKKAILDEIIRVDQAGEYGALNIYDGQLAVLGNSKYAKILEEMREQERGHLATFDKLIQERRVRPSALGPLWHVAGYSLGFMTAFLGHESAMACTQAVEEVITEHYNEQLRILNTEFPEEEELRKIIKVFRDDEEHHHDTAIKYDALEAPFHTLLYNGIKIGTKIAVVVASKI